MATENQIVLYTTGCPRCVVLKKKLAEKNISYAECDSGSDMAQLGITHVPVLSVKGQLLDFTSAIKWVNQQTGREDC